MQTAPSFVESWLNEPAGRVHVVLGQRLRPFCPWYSLLLDAIESPLVRQGATPTLADLSTAVRICRSRYHDPLSRTIPGPSRHWLTRAWRQGRATWVSSKYSVPGTLEAFDRYLQDYVAPPEFWQEDKRGAEETQNRLPDMLGVTAQLMARGVPEFAAWEMPMGRARWYAAAFAKLDGVDVRFRTESNEFFNALDLLKARIAAKKAGQQKPNP